MRSKKKKTMSKKQVKKSRKTAKKQIKKSAKNKIKVKKKVAKRGIQKSQKKSVKKSKSKILKIGNIYVLPGEGPDCNTYVIKDKVTTLIDPGLLPKEKLLKKIGLNPNKINLVINTHCHYDHSATDNLYKKAKIIAHKEAVKVMKSRDSKTCLSDIYSAEMPEYGEVEVIGKTIDLGKTKFKVIETPGHTKCSVSLFEPRLGVLICGDLVFAYGWVGNTIYPGGSHTSLKKSLDKIKALRIRFVLPGHGPIGTKNDVLKALKIV